MSFPTFRIPPAILLVFCLGIDSQWVSAQTPPAISFFSPLGIAPQGRTELTVHGSHLAGANELWITPDIRASLSPDLKNNGQNDSQATFRVEIPTGTPLGIHGCRVHTPGGLSGLKLLLIDDLPTVQEAGKHGSMETAQDIEIPCAVDGRISNLERDFYRFEVKAGQRLTVETYARRLGSPLDSVVILYREDGRELAYSDDAAGLSSDSQFVHTFEQDGRYVIEIRDIQYRGGATSFYRLRMGDFPAINTAYPMGVQRGQASVVHLAGIDVEETPPVTIQVPDDWPLETYPIAAKRTGGQASGFAFVFVGSGTETTEQEPNNDSEQATPVVLGSQINGRIDSVGDVDWFRFSAKKGESFLFQGITRQAGSPTDLVLTIHDAQGKRIARVDDTGTDEGRLLQKFPQDGDYYLKLHHLHSRGGPAYAYRIHVEKSTPGFTLAAATDIINVPAGGTQAITVNAARTGYQGPIQLSVTGLPKGVHADPTTIGPGMTSAVLTVSANKDAPSENWSNVQIVGTASHQNEPLQAIADAGKALLATWNNRTLAAYGFRYSLGAAVTPATKLSLRTEPAEVTLGRNLTATIKVIAERGDGIDQAIALAMTPAKKALPDGVSLKLSPIPQGKNEITLQLSANEKAPLGPFSVVLNGTHKKGKETTSVFTPSINYRLEPAMTLNIDAGEKTIARGAELKIKVKVQKNPALAGPVKLTILGLPQGVTTEEVELSDGQDDLTLVLKASNDAPVGEIKDLKVKAVSVNQKNVTLESTLPILTVVE